MFSQELVNVYFGYNARVRGIEIVKKTTGLGKYNFLVSGVGFGLTPI